MKTTEYPDGSASWIYGNTGVLYHRAAGAWYPIFAYLATPDELNARQTSFWDNAISERYRIIGPDSTILQEGTKH